MQRTKTFLGWTISAKAKNGQKTLYFAIDHHYGIFHSGGYPYWSENPHSIGLTTDPSKVLGWLKEANDLTGEIIKNSTKIVRVSTVIEDDEDFVKITEKKAVALAKLTEEEKRILNLI